MQYPKFSAPHVGEKTENMADPKKPQTNFYIERALDDDLRDEVVLQQKKNREYSRTQFFNDATRILLMVLRYMRESKAVGDDPYTFVRDALKTYMGR